MARSVVNHAAASAAQQVGERLAEAIPKPVCELRHESPFELLAATILSAQSTDRRVNLVTPELFRRWPTPPALAVADPLEVEDVIRSTGFFRNKAKALRGMAARLVEHHGGEVPAEMDALTALPGVARKTANVVLGTAFGIASGLVVDTHAGRVARRLGLTAANDPVKVEADLCGVFPREAWVDLGHRLVLHGRYVCLARKPRCVECPLNEVCPSAEAPPVGAPVERARAEGQRVLEGYRANLGADPV